MGKKIVYTEIGRKWGKIDMERIGLFADSNYLHGKGWVPPVRDVRTYKGRQMLPEGAKVKVGLQDCYFEKSRFKRIFEKEAIPKPSKKKGAKGKEQIKQPMIPVGPTKKHACPGDHFGTFSGIIKALGRKQRPKPKYVREKPNVLTNPGKKGGCGYVDICLEKYPKHSVEKPIKKKKEVSKKVGGVMLTVIRPKPYFDEFPYKEVSNKRGLLYIRPKQEVPKVLLPQFIPPNPPKMPGNNHDGCFHKFPEWKKDPMYKSKPKVTDDKSKAARIFYPQSRALKSMYISSSVNQNVDFKVNERTWRNAEPEYVGRYV